MPEKIAGGTKRVKERDRARLCPRGGGEGGGVGGEGEKGVTPTQGMTYAGGLRRVRAKEKEREVENWGRLPPDWEGSKVRSEGRPRVGNA